MAQPYVGEIRMFAGNFAPASWMFCSGQLLPISEYETLFNLIGTTYGGDGQTTFALPDLQGRLPIHQGGGLTLGESGGAESITLTVNQMPAHTHQAMGSTNTGTGTAPANNVLCNLVAATNSGYGTDNPQTNLNPQSTGSMGANQPHSNFQPYLCINFIISLFGIFPSQT
jgi:microcystin-dependent protein